MSLPEPRDVSASEFRRELESFYRDLREKARVDPDFILADMAASGVVLLERPIAIVVRKTRDGVEAVAMLSNGWGVALRYVLGSQLDDEHAYLYVPPERRIVLVRPGGGEW